MIAAKLIFQSLAGVGAVVGVAGGGYLAAQQESQPENYSYLLVKASAKDASEVQTLAKSLKERSYYCEITDSKDSKLTDSFCEIFKTSSDSTNSLKEINLSLINKEEGVLKNNNDLVVDKNHVLKINKKKYSEGIKEISIIGTKSFGKLTPLFEFKKDISDFSTNLIIVQTPQNLVTTTVAINATKKTVCSAGAETEKFDCDIYKFSTDKTTNIISSSDLQGSSKITTTSEIKANNFYLLDLKDKEYKRSDFSNKQLKIFHQTVPNDASVITDTAITSLNFSQLVLGNLKESQKIALPISSHTQTYIVKVKTETVSGLTTELINSEAKNYTCKSGDIEDTSCELFQIGFDATKGSIPLTSIQSSLTRETNKDKLKTGNLFKLQINKNIADDLLFSSITLSTIDLVSKADPTKKYATFTLDYKFTNNKVLGNTTFFLVKPVNNTLISDSTSFPTNFKCKINDSTDKERCDIYKFSTSPTDKANLKFSEAKTPVSKADIVSTNFLIIDLKNTSISASTTSQIITVFNSATNNPKLFDATIDTAFISHNNSNKKFAEVITIK